MPDRPISHKKPIEVFLLQFMKIGSAGVLISQMPFFITDRIVGDGIIENSFHLSPFR